MQRRIVDLPEPLGPTITTTSPSSTWRFTSRTAWIVLSKVLVRSLSVIMSALPLAVAGHSPFEYSEEKGEAEGEDQVDERDDEVALTELEGAG